MKLKRRVGTSSTYVEATVYGKDTAFSPTEIVGAVKSGDRRIRIAQLDIAAAGWPGDVPPGAQASQWPDCIKAGDKIDDATVEGARTLHEGAELVGYVVHVAGG